MAVSPTRKKAPRILCLGNQLEDLSSMMALRAMELGVGLSGIDLAGSFCLSNGSSGFLNAMSLAIGGSIRRVMTRDPLNRLHIAKYLFNAYRSVAMIEAAEVIGNDLVAPDDRNLMNSSSRGLADLLMHAVGYGATHIFIGLGATATCDGGVGMLRRLESALLDDGQGHEALGARDLQNPPYVDLSMIRDRLKDVKITVFADSLQPLLGESGAVQSRGEEQNATQKELGSLEMMLSRWAEVLEPKAGRNLKDIPGAGAGGGLGMAFAALGATIDRGADRLTRLINLEERLDSCNGLITCEEHLGDQTFLNSAAWVAAQYAIANDRRAVMFCVSCDSDAVNRAIHEGVDVIEIGQNLHAASRRTPELFTRLEEKVSALAKRFSV